MNATLTSARGFDILLSNSDNHEPGSFRWICDNLDLDPSWFRRRLFALVDAALVSRRSPRWYRNAP
jgi:hypothetical protein